MSTCHTEYKNKQGSCSMKAVGLYNHRQQIHYIHDSLELAWFRLGPYLHHRQVAILRSMDQRCEPFLCRCFNACSLSNVCLSIHVKGSLSLLIYTVSHWSNTVILRISLEMWFAQILLSSTTIPRKPRTFYTSVENMEDPCKCLLLKLQGFSAGNCYRRRLLLDLHQFTLVVFENLFLWPYLNICQYPCFGCFEQILQYTAYHVIHNEYQRYSTLQRHFCFKPGQSWTDLVQPAVTNSIVSDLVTIFHIITQTKLCSMLQNKTCVVVSTVLWIWCSS